MPRKKKETEQKVVSFGSAKVFRYNVGFDALVDGNIAQIPFVRPYEGKPQTILEYIWYTKESGNIIKRGIYVSGHGEYGVPTLREYDVYVALERIFINKRTKYGLCELLAPNEAINDYLNIEFTLNELAKELGYAHANSGTRELIKKSIRILLATTLFARYAGGVYDIRNKKYITNAEVGIHLLDTIESGEIYDEDGNPVVDVTRIRLSKFSYEQILNDYKLFYDIRKYNMTRNLMARKIYHMALQWKGNNKISWANINTLIERIPMIDVEDKYKKRDIKKVLKLMDSVGMVKIKYDTENEDKVYFIFSDDDEEIDTALLQKYNTYADIRDAYFNIGFTLDELDKYLNVENIRYIQALLRYLDDTGKSSNMKDVKKYIKTCIENPLKNLPSKYYSKDKD